MPDFIEQQKKLCKKLELSWVMSDPGLMIGLGKGFDSETMPINGLRHPITETTTGWYIWAGELSQAADFFTPHHAMHIGQEIPIVLPYLGLPPGWRFQIDDKGYEDIWEDLTLLKV